MLELSHASFVTTSELHYAIFWLFILISNDFIQKGKTVTCISLIINVDAGRLIYVRRHSDRKMKFSTNWMSKKPDMVNYCGNLEKAEVAYYENQAIYLHGPIGWDRVISCDVRARYIRGKFIPPALYIPDLTEGRRSYYPELLAVGLFRWSSSLLTDWYEDTRKQVGHKKVSAGFFWFHLKGPSVIIHWKKKCIL